MLEFAAILPASAIVGFLGPFGSFLTDPFLTRAARWLALLLGAWLVVRPSLFLLDRLALATHLPRHPVRWFGMVAISGPLSLVWRSAGLREAATMGLAGVLLIALLCSALVAVISWWAERADAQLRVQPETVPSMNEAVQPTSSAAAQPAPAPPEHSSSATSPRLRHRLSTGFDAPILALESEDHYVRVHSSKGSELILLRLRDAIAEMDDYPGMQTHRSWWIASQAIAAFAPETRRLTLTNGTTAPVARDIVARLQREGFLSA